MLSPEVEPLLVFTLEGQRFGLRTSIVQRAVRAVEITPLPDAPRGIRGLINIGGTIVPVYDFRSRFEMPVRAVRSSDFFVIATAHGKLVAVLVDDVVGLMESPVIPTEDLVAHVELIDGVIKTDTDLVLIHDLDKFLAEDQAIPLGATQQQ